MKKDLFMKYDFSDSELKQLALILRESQMITQKNELWAFQKFIDTYINETMTIDEVECFFNEK